MKEGKPRLGNPPEAYRRPARKVRRREDFLEEALGARAAGSNRVVVRLN
jgi:hypothetical protein